MSKYSNYDVIRNPVVTEKSTMASEHSQVVFEVAIDATKPEIKAAVEALFSVKVKAVIRAGELQSSEIGEPSGKWGHSR
jgi:large subunit ribosomal protein L23